MVESVAVLDVVGTVGFFGAVVVSLLAYRETDAEAGFWLNFAVASLLGFLWAGSVSLEKLGIGSGEVLDILSVSLLTATIAVFAVGATGTYAVVEDMKRSRAREAESRAEAESLTASLEADAEEFDGLMRRAADGDLTVRMSDDGESRAMASVARSFNAMMTDLERTVQRIQQFAGDVAASTTELSASAGEVKTASEEVSETMVSVSSETEHQHGSLSDAANEMSNLSATIEEVAATATQVASVSNEAAELGENGRVAAMTALDEMTHIREQTSRTVTEVEGLHDELGEIVSIVDLINQIAERTNLLALNASIEAASAGEVGSGFAVVAEEIKKLAGEAGEATDRVEDLIAEIQQSAAGTVTDMHGVGERVNSGTETVETALNALDDIVARVKEANDGVQEINRATTDQASSTEGVLGRVDEARRSSERTSQEVTNVSAASEEQTASMAEVSASVDSLSAIATELSDLLAAFRVTGTGHGPYGDVIDVTPAPATDARVPHDATPAPVGRGANGAAPVADGGYDRPDRR